MEFRAGFEDPVQDGDGGRMWEWRVIGDGTSAGIALARPADQLAVAGIRAALRPVQLLMSFPSVLFLAALTAMLLRHPDVHFLEIDRFAFGVLVLSVAARALVLREGLFVL